MRFLRLAALVWVSLLGLVGSVVQAQTSKYLYYPLVVVFGDSLSDAGQTYSAGNKYCQNYLMSNPNGSCYPYPGPTYGYATGQFTDGVDSVPATQQYSLVWHTELTYLLPGYTGAPLLIYNEVDDAWGGAQTTGGFFTDNNGPVPLNAENMGQQVADFLNSGYPVSSSYLYVLEGGMEDLLADSSTASAAAAAQRLANLVGTLASNGAYQFLIPNLPPLTARPASTAYNNAATLFNADLAADLAMVEQKYTIKVTLVDISSLFQAIIANPAAYGFSNITTPANVLGYSINPDTYLSWDGINPTTAGHYQIAYAACTALTQTRTTVSVSSATSTTANPATITATVSTSGTYGTPSSGSPTGSVTFYSYDTLLGTAPLQANGTATLSAMSLPTGTLHVSAVYSGDGNFPSGCAQSPVPLVVSSSGPSGTPGSVLTVSPATLTIGLGGTASTSVTANDGTSTTIYDISCGTVPADLTCSVENGIIQSKTLGTATVFIFGGTLAEARPAPDLHRGGSDAPGAIAFALAAPFGLVALAFGRRGRWAGWLLVVLLSVGLVTLTSCSAGTTAASSGSGGGGRTPPQYIYPAPGTYTVQIVGTVYATKATTTANLTVVVN